MSLLLHLEEIMLLVKELLIPIDVVEESDKEEEEQHDDDIELQDVTQLTFVNQS